MRNIIKILLIGLAISGHFCFAQISMTKVAEEQKNIKIESYDGLKNFLGTDFMKYKGQELYLLPKSKELRKFGYENFIKNTKQSIYNSSNIYKCCDGYNSKYKDLQGKYFIVEDVIPDTTSYGRNAFLKLKIKDTNEIVYFNYDSEYMHSFPFIVTKFYEKQKEIFINKTVVLRPFPKINSMQQIKNLDIDTGKEIPIKAGEQFTCLDITIHANTYELSLLLKNTSGEKFLFPMYSRFLDVQRIFTLEEAEDYKKKFGEENWQTILHEEIKIGFTEEMVTVSWGKPKKINRTSYGDQWIYAEQYLYFENKILKAFN